MEDEKNPNPVYDFIKKVGSIINSGQSRTIAITGNIYDLFFSLSRREYIPILEFILSEWNKPELKPFMRIVYSLNEPVRFLSKEDEKLMKAAWINFFIGLDRDEAAIKKITTPFSFKEKEKKYAEKFDTSLSQTKESPTLALEFLRQLCLISRSKIGQAALQRNLIILIEGADMLVPEGEIARLSEADRKRIAILGDWFLDPEFMNGRDSVILITESMSLLNEKISRLSQILEVVIPSPDQEQRLQCINWFVGQAGDKKPKFWSIAEELATYTAGLTTQALLQMLIEASYTGKTIEPKTVVDKIERFLKAQLGDDVVEFKKPKHTLDDVVGHTKIKKFIMEDFIPRLQEGAIAGATVGGAIGVGKTYLFEAVASILGIPVLVLKNIRSMWFGETDVIVERLRRILNSFHQVMIFVDEADTQFGGVGKEVHETERRLTGKVQAIMSDPLLKGKVIWLLLTARIYLLSKDVLRKGRAGGVIFALTDPEGEDRKKFINWVLAPVIEKSDEELIQLIDKWTKGYSPDDFNSLRDDLRVKARINARQAGKDGILGMLGKDCILEVVKNRIPSDISDFRRAQTLHALLKCSDIRLLPEGCNENNIDEQRKKWRAELASLASVLD